MIHNSESSTKMRTNKTSHTTPRHEAKLKNLTPESCRKSLKKFRSIRGKYFADGIKWLHQFVKKRDGIHPKNFAKTARINEDHFCQILNGKANITKEMFTRIAIGIGLLWDEIVELRLARFHECQMGCLSEKNMEKVRRKRTDDLKKEFISYFGNDARAVLDMLDSKDDLLAIANYYQGKYPQQFK